MDSKIFRYQSLRNMVKKVPKQSNVPVRQQMLYTLITMIFYHTQRK